MNPASKLNWLQLITVLGVSFAVVASCDPAIMLMSWGGLHIRRLHEAYDMIHPFTMAAWIGELICGIIILQHRKTIGQILIMLGIVLYLSAMLIPASG